MDLEKLGNTVKELEQSSKQIKNFSEIFAELAELKNSVSQNNDFFKGVSSKLEKISVALEDELKSFKATLKELDSALVSRLDRHKSDIQVEIRNEGIQLQRSFDNSLTKNFTSLEKLVNEKCEKLTKQIKSNRYLIIVNLIFLLTNIGLIIYLLMK